MSPRTVLAGSGDEARGQISWIRSIERRTSDNDGKLLAAQEWETETSLSPAAEGMAVTRWEHPDQERKRHRHSAGTAERF